MILRILVVSMMALLIVLFQVVVINTCTSSQNPWRWGTPLSSHGPDDKFTWRCEKISCASLRLQQYLPFFTCRCFFRNVLINIVRYCTQITRDSGNIKLKPKRVWSAIEGSHNPREASLCWWFLFLRAQRYALRTKTTYNCRASTVQYSTVQY